MQARRLSVLHVCQPPDGGAAAVVRNLACHQSDRGFDVSVACPPGSRLACDLARAGLHVSPWNAVREPSPGVIAHEGLELRSILGRIAPDIVHLHSSKAGLVGRCLLRGTRPTVFQPHGWSFYAVDGRAKQAAIAWERRAAAWSDAIVCVSEDERRDARAVGVHATFAVIPNGVDTARYASIATADRSEARRSLGFGDVPTVVCVGRLCRAKGQDVLLGIWREVERVLPTAQLVLVGDGPDRGTLEHVSRSGRVYFTGESDRVDSYLAAADVVAVPSRWEAGASLALFEAMAAARPVVAFDVAGVADAVGAVRGGLIAQGDVVAFARALVERLCDADLGNREGAALCERAFERFDAARSAAGYPLLYESLLTFTPGSPRSILRYSPNQRATHHLHNGAYEGLAWSSVSGHSNSNGIPHLPVPARVTAGRHPS